MMNGAELIIQERQRQKKEEGFTIAGDVEEYKHNELVRAAQCYAMEEEHRKCMNEDGEDIFESGFWPWPKEWFKSDPNDRITDLKKAGALLAAEIDRLIQVAN